MISYRLPLRCLSSFPQGQMSLTSRMTSCGPRSRLSRNVLLTNTYKYFLAPRQQQNSRTGATRSIRRNYSSGRDIPHAAVFKGEYISWIVLGVGTSVLWASCVEPLETSTVPAESDVDHNDPLSKLNPSILVNTNAHLRALPFIDLFRLYFVYFASSSSHLVAAGPVILSKLEWTRDNIPVVGSLIWKAFAAVSDVCGDETALCEGGSDLIYSGASVPECEELANRFASQGIGCLLIYSAEASLDGSAAQTGVNNAHIEEACQAIVSASNFLRKDGNQLSKSNVNLRPSTFAIKLSGFVYDPQLLRRASCAMQNSTSNLRGMHMDSSVLFPASPQLSDADHEQLNELFNALRRIGKHAKVGKVRLFLDAEQSWYQPAIDRYAELLAEDFNKPESGVSGPCIPIINNTYQAYLRETPEKVAAHMAAAHKKGISFGAKLVRGAYVESERAKWTIDGKKGSCVVWDSKAESDAAFDECAAILEQKIAEEVKLATKEKQPTPGTAVCLATHNSTSVKKLLQAMESHGMAMRSGDGLILDPRLRGRISFAQLLGMSDNLTSTLTSLISPIEERADSNYIPWVLKYVAYASVEQALPYLIRRANENQAILRGDPSSGRGGANAERRAVGREIRKRMGISW